MPLVAPAGIVNFKAVAVAPELIVTAVPFRVTVAFNRLVPLTLTTVVPFVPVAGVNDLMVGAGGTTVNESVFTVPPPFTNLMVPVRAPVGTTTVTEVAELVTALAALLPPKTIEVSLAKLVPLMVIVSPTLPLWVTEVTVGAR